MYAKRLKVRSSTPKDAKRVLLNYNFGNMFYFANVRATKTKNIEQHFVSVLIVVNGKILNISRELAYILEEPLGGYRTQFLEVRDCVDAGAALIRRISMALNEGVILKVNYSYQWL